MRILQVAPPWFAVPPAAYGGIEWVVSSLADGLTGKGHEVTLVASGGSRTDARLQVVFEQPPSALLGDPGIEAIQALTAFLERGHYDLVHDHSGAVLVALASVAPAGPPVLHTLHGAWTPERSRLYELVAPPVHLVAISQDQADRAPHDVEVAAVVHNGIPLAPHPFITGKEDRLAFVGRANPDKGPDVAIEVARRTGLPLTLCIKVNEPSEHHYFDDVLRPLLDTADVTLLLDPGPVEKAEALGRARSVLCPLRWPEPFGLVMAEAQACGTPVIAWSEGAAPELIDHGRTGFLVAPGDVDGLVRAVEKAGELSPYDCRARVEEHFSADRMVTRYEETYRAILTARAGAGDG